MKLLDKIADFTVVLLHFALDVVIFLTSISFKLTAKLCMFVYKRTFT